MYFNCLITIICFETLGVSGIILENLLESSLYFVVFYLSFDTILRKVVRSVTQEIFVQSFKLFYEFHQLFRIIFKKIVSEWGFKNPQNPTLSTPLNRRTYNYTMPIILHSESRNQRAYDFLVCELFSFPWQRLAVSFFTNLLMRDFCSEIIPKFPSSIVSNVWNLIQHSSLPGDGSCTIYVENTCKQNTRRQPV